MSEQYIKLQDILAQGEWEVSIPGLGKLKCRNPTVKDRIEAEVEARKHPSWNSLSLMEQRTEFQRRLALKMIVEPKLSEDSYLGTDYVLMDTLLLVVSREYDRRQSKLNEALQSFLELPMEGSPRSSTGS
jgi:hypothetical protein